MDKPTRACADCGTSLAGTHANTTRCKPCNRLKRIKSVPRTACTECGGSMEGKRADAEYCSIPCSQRAGHRRRNPHPAERRCGTCGTDISGRDLRAKFCETCAGRRQAYPHTHAPVRIDRECANCGKPFIAKRADSACCSRKCTQARINAVHNPKVRHEPRPCPSCGTEFTPKRSDRIACSTRCYGRLTRTYVPIWHNKTCVICGKPFVSKRSDAVHCSQGCTQRRHYEINSEAIREAVAAWRAANSDRCRVNGARYKAKRKGWESAGVGVSFRDWTRLQARHGWRCAYCHAKPGLLHMEHVVPLSRGGQHAIGNILPACPDCNMSKGAKLLVEWRKRR